MFENFAQQINSADPSVRRQGIVGLANSGKKEALNLLQELVSHESDPAVKQVATKAVQHLQRALWKEAELASSAPKPSATGIVGAPPATSSSSSSTSGIKPTEGGSALSRARTSTTSADKAIAKAPAPLSEEKRKIARGKLDAAMSQQLLGKHDKAILELKQALKINPELYKDSFAIGMIFSLTGKTPDEARVMLETVEDNTAKEMVATGAMTTLYFFLELAGLAIGIALYFAIFFNKLLPSLENSGLGNFATQWAAIKNPITLFALFLPTAIGSTISILIPTFVMYIVGAVMGGTGSVVRFMRVMIRCYAGLMFMLAILFLLSPADTFTSTKSASLFLTLLGIGSLVALIAQAFFAGRAHNVSIWRGATIVFLGNLATSCLYGFIATQLARRALGA